MLSRILPALLITGFLPVQAQDEAPPLRPEPVVEDIATKWFEEADRVYNYAKVASDKFEQQRALRACIPLYERFIARFPKDDNVPAARYRCGVAHLLLGNRGAAETYFTKTISASRRRGHQAGVAAFRLGGLAYNDKYFKTAIPHFQLAASEVDKASIRHQSLNYLARCYLLTDRTKDASVILRRLVNDPEEPNAYKDSARLALAHISATQGQLEEAFALYQDLSMLDSKDPEVLEIRAQAIVHGGMAALQLPGKREIGLKMLNTAIRTVGLPDESKTEAQLTLMQLAFDQENHEEVLSLFRLGPFTAARADTAAKVLLLGGRSAAKLGQHNAAIEMFNGVDRAVPNTRIAFEASYRKLLSFYELRSPVITDLVESFVEIYGGRYAKSPWIQEARVMRAETFFSFGDFASATRAWERVNFARLPEDMRGPAYFKSGWALVENEDYNSAIGQLSEFISRFPESPDLHAALAKRAQAYLAVGDRITALADCERVLTEKPRTPLASFALQLSGRLYRLERKHDKMIESYQTLLTNFEGLSPDTIARAHYKIGIGLFEEGDYEQALSEFAQARQMVPEFYEDSAGTYSAMCQYRLKDADALRQTVSRLYSVNPRKVLPRRMLLWLGLQMYEKSNFSAADHYLSIAATPENPTETDLGVWKALAKSRLEVPGQQTRAIEALEIILAQEDDPFWRSDAFLDKANALIALNEWDEAEISAHRGLDFDPQGTIKAGLHLALGDVALARADYEGAANSYVRAAELFLNEVNIQPMALHKAAYCFAELGDQTKAQAFRDRLRLAHPDWQAPDKLDIVPGSALKRTHTVTPPPSLPEGVTPISIPE